jgi:RHS repeat-associated protein
MALIAALRARCLRTLLASLVLILPLADAFGAGQSYTLEYDANGAPIGVTDALNQSTRWSLDSLGRPVAITDAAGVTATLQYNPLDAVIQASDFKGVATTYRRDAQGNPLHESSPDIGGRITRFDVMGQPSEIVDALGQLTRISRDALGRPVNVAFADGKSTTLVYDGPATGKGYLTSFTDRSGSTQYWRDSFRRVILKRQLLANGSTQRVNYSYQANGLPASITYPDGSTLGYRHDATGRLVQLEWNGQPLVTGIAWNPMGRPTGWRWAFVDPASGGLEARRRYDTAARLTGTEFASYVHDPAGRIVSLTQQLFGPADANPANSTIALAPVTWSVGYDRVNRITKFEAAGQTTSFSYDQNGNRVANTRTSNGVTTSRTYALVDGTNRQSGFTQSSGGTSTQVVYTHNENGDLVSDGLRTYSYDAEQRLSAVTTGATDSSPTTRYAHNALGQRVFKTEPLYPPAEGDEADAGFMQSLIAFFTRLWAPGASDAERLGTAFVYDEQGSLIAEVGMGGAHSSGSTQYIYLPTASGPMPIAAVINGALYAVHSDHLNTPRRLTNANGQAVWQWAYSAFGDEKPTIAKYRFADLDVTPNPGTTSVPAIVFNQRKPGQYADAESGLVHNGARYFCPACGRFTQVDPARLDGGWSPYEYLLNNPLSFIDDDGYAPKNPNSAEPLRIMPSAGGRNTVLPPSAQIPRIDLPVPFCPPAAKGSIWSSTKKLSSVENALGHWNKHKAEFPELANSKQYVEAAHSLAANPPGGALTKPRGAETLIYDQATNTFLVRGADGVPKTMFRPTDGINYWNKQ